MPFPNKDTQFQKGQSGNPVGKPKGTKHLSTWIQDLLNDEEFSVENANFGGKPYKGAPMRAIIMVAINQALQGEQKWADWLGKYGYGTKSEVDVTTLGDSIKSEVPTEIVEKFTQYLKDSTKD